MSDKPKNLKCPECNGPMVSRLNKINNTRFWGCSGFPVCRGTRDINGLSRYDRGIEPEQPDEGWDERKYYK